MPEMAYSAMPTSPQPKPLFWMSSTHDELRRFPQEVRQVMGYALYLAQCGDKHLDAKPLKGFGGAGVLEVVADHDGDTYRAVYTVRFADAVYALHAFQKKSKRGVATPKREIERIRQRLRQAQEHYQAWRRQHQGETS
jgi:phage-related protein